MEKNIRLISIDMDGTLLDSKWDIPEENVAALREAADKGLAVCINTGRMAQEAQSYARKYGFPCVASGLNGGKILDEQGNVLHRAFLLPEEAMRLCELLLPSGLYAIAYFDDFMVKIDAVPPLHRAYPIEKREGIKRYEGEAALLEAAKAGMAKMVVMGEAADERLAALATQVRRELPQLTLTRSAQNNIEIGPAGTGKGEALRLMCEYKGVPLLQAMAIGDEQNDLPMLRLAGVGVAMGNAGAEVKAASDVVTRTNDEAGVAHAIRRYALGKDEA